MECAHRRRWRRAGPDVEPWDLPGVRRVVTAKPRRVKRSCSGVLLAELQQVLPRIDPRGVPIAPLNLHRIPPDLMHPLRPHILLHLLLAHDAPPAPLLHALRARTPRPQPPRRKLRLPPVVPSDEQVALVVERQIG